MGCSWELVVLSDPALNGTAILLEATLREVAKLPEANIQVAEVEWKAPGETETTRFMLPLDFFNVPFGDRDADAVIKGAPPFKPKRSSGSGDERDYTSPEFAGLIHRGKVTDAEAEYVRAHLDEVNARRAAQNPPQPPIDPANQKDHERYRLPAPEPASAAEPEPSA